MHTLFDRRVQPNLKLTHFMTAIAKALVESQIQLDAAGHDQLDAWDEHGVPPIFRVWTECRFEVPVLFKSHPKQRPDEQTQISLQAADESRTQLQFAVHYHPLVQQIEEA